MVSTLSVLSLLFGSLKTFSSSPILRISICCFYGNSLQLRDSQGLAVTASKVLIDTGFQVGGDGRVEMRMRNCRRCVYECVRAVGGWGVVSH